MKESAEFVLQLKKFKENANNNWQKLRNEDRFSDVTLACLDNQMRAHKVVLAASSPILENILIQNSHPNPLIYLTGVKYSDLVVLLDFIYLGEVAIMKEELQGFLALANEFKIKGLTEETIGHEVIERTPPRKRKWETSSLSQNTAENFSCKNIEEDSIDSLVKTDDTTVGINNTGVEHPSKASAKNNESDELKLKKNDSKNSVNIAHENENISYNFTDLRELSSNIIEANNKEDTIELEKTTNLNNYELEKLNIDGNNVHRNEVAGYEKHVLSETIDITDKESNTKRNDKTNQNVNNVINSSDTRVNTHKIKKESNVKQSVNNDKNTSSHSTRKKICKLCSFKTDGARDLDLHRQTIHQDRIFCEQCDYGAKSKGNLKKHVLSIHEGILHNCDRCDYKSSEKAGVNRHKRAIHGEGTLWYFCDKCSYSAIDKGPLKRHKLSIHEGVRYVRHRCSECSYVTVIENRLEDHMASKHGK